MGVFSLRYASIIKLQNIEGLYDMFFLHFVLNINEQVLSFILVVKFWSLRLVGVQFAPSVSVVSCRS